jgi:hypothetical protein
MDEGRRWIVGLIVALALVAFIVLATGAPGRGRGDGSQPAAIEVHEAI